MLKKKIQFLKQTKAHLIVAIDQLVWDLDARLFLIDFLTGIDVTNRIAFLVEEGPDPYVENIYIYIRIPMQLLIICFE